MSLFVSPAVRATDANNLALSGATWNFYLTGTTTPANVYSSATLTTSLGSSVPANTGGLFPSIYLDPTITYRAILKDSSGQTIADYDPYIRAREKLTSNQVYYVRPDGSDSNNGVANTASSAFLTIQKAIDAAYKLDCNGFKVIIEVADGTYTGGLSVYGKLLGGKDSQRQQLQIIGNETTPANVVVSTVGNALTVADHAYCLVAGITWQTTTTGVGWQVLDHAILEHRNCAFGNCAQEMMLLADYAETRASGPLTVSGNADSFCHATKKSLANFTGQTISFAGNSFTTYVWGVNDSTVLCPNSLTGTAPVAGKTTVHINGILNVGSMDDTTSFTGSYLGPGTLLVAEGGRIVADSDLNFYVRSDGNDNHDGLKNTPGRAFATVQGAIDALSKRAYDPDIWNTSGANLNIPAGTYTGITLRDTKFTSMKLIGDVVTPSNVVIAGTTDGIGALGTRTNWTVKGVKITAAAGDCLRVEQGSVVHIDSVEFGSASGNQIACYTGGIVIADGNYKISAGAANHVQLTRGHALLSSRTITITNTPAFSSAFASLFSNSSMVAKSMTFTGSATGVRYNINTNSTIDTGGQAVTYLPGGTSGTTATGGQYA